MLLRSSVSKTISVLLNQSRFASATAKSANLNRLLLNMSRKDEGKGTTSKGPKHTPTKYCPGTVTLQVLGSGGAGSPASVYLFTDQSRYLFNCGEGTQRLAHEHKTKLSRLEHIFLTRTSWDKIGGLPGLSLTLQDAGVRNLTLHGPTGLDEIFRAMRRFVVLKTLRVDAEPFGEKKVYEDDVLTINYVWIEKSQKKKIGIDNEEKLIAADLEADDTDYFEYENGKRESPTIPSVLDYEKREENAVICYICKLKPKPGALNLEKCVEKGVPAGPLLGQLKNGKDVTLQDGTIVTAQEVTAPSDPGPVFIFLDIPNEDYLDSLSNEKLCFKNYQSTATDDANAALCVVHFSPQEIINTGIYKQFIENFSASTRHLVLNGSNKFSGYTAAHRIQWQLHQIHDKMFPLLHECPETKCDQLHHMCKKIKVATTADDNFGSKSKTFIEEEEISSNKIDVSEEKYIDYTNSLTCYHLRPRKGFDRTSEATLDPSSYLDEAYKIEGFNESLASLKESMTKIDLHNDRDNEYPKITFLGTGSCIPNKTRNVSSILIHSSPESCLLLDCGEGTWGQIIRFYGEDEAARILLKLKIIYISHLHADHHMGLISILNTRQHMLGDKIDPVTLLAPKQLGNWLYFYNQRIEQIGDSYTLVSNDNLLRSPYTSVHLSSMGIENLSTCLVRHCPFAFGVAINFHNACDSNSPIKITYSGDTEPCNELISLGTNSTVLIHEATMEDELVEEARRKRHSTISEAIEQGKKMNAKYTILTHFSQRYAKIPRISEPLPENVGIAFDNMELTISELNLLHLMYPTFKILFSEHFEEMEQKAFKRTMKLERKKQAQQEQMAKTSPPR